MASVAAYGINIRCAPPLEEEISHCFGGIGVEWLETEIYRGDDLPLSEGELNFSQPWTPMHAIWHRLLPRELPRNEYRILICGSVVYAVPIEADLRQDPEKVISNYDFVERRLEGMVLQIAYGPKELPEEPCEPLEGLNGVPCYDGDIARRPKLGSTPFEVRRGGIPTNATMLTGEEVEDGQSPYM